MRQPPAGAGPRRGVCPAARRRTAGSRDGGLPLTEPPPTARNKCPAHQGPRPRAPDTSRTRSEGVPGCTGLCGGAVGARRTPWPSSKASYEEGHLCRVPYESSRRRNTRADAYLCSLCKESPASAWDHCHDHGFVRGPLCGSRNTHEAKASPDWFLRHEDNVLHVLERLTAANSGLMGCRQIGMTVGVPGAGSATGPRAGPKPSACYAAVAPRLPSSPWIRRAFSTRRSSDCTVQGPSDLGGSPITRRWPLRPSPRMDRRARCTGG
ncbi:endonuclease domain-containing protein [Streptomyces sp. NPDC088253]|uniref:endonuclease domain-containing protein n=1 Tax=Streptomyces sp. NPDC088253 TaxID=3365846 RepID=UPI0038287191